MFLPDTVKVFPNALADFISHEPVDLPKGTILFGNKSLFANMFDWSFGDGYYSSDTGMVAHRYDANNIFEVELVANNEFNCPDTAIQFITPHEFHGLFVPKAFCPTCPDDAIREFCPKGVGIDTYQIQIYDTWGNVLWESKALDQDGRPAECWDGKQDGVLLPTDAYAWRVKAIFRNGEKWQGMPYGNKGRKKDIGTVTLIR